MAIRKKSSTTRLPQSLLGELEESTTNDHAHKRSRLPRSSRKDARKQDRAVKKQNKANYFSQAHASNFNATSRLKRGAEGEHAESPKRKKFKSEGDRIPQSVGQRTSTSEGTPPNPKPPTVSPKERTKPSNPSKPAKSRTPALPRSRVDEEEDTYIAYLETKLGLGKGAKQKKKPSEEDDGLDDLLSFADSVIKPMQDSEDDALQEDYDEDSDSGSASHYSDEVWGGITQQPNEARSPYDQVSESDSEPTDSGSADPKGKATKEVSTTGRYVPPHMRNPKPEDSNDSEATQRLTRQLKGLLNRMSEQNIASIITSVEELYREHRRNDVTSTLTTLIINGISDHSSLLDSFVVIYAAFVASLHKIIGVDFAAHFVQNAVADYEKYYAALSLTPPTAPSSDSTEEPVEPKDGKECSNLLVLISELYNFQVISSVLVFDTIRALLQKDMTELKVELLLKLLRNSGQQLRQDDPSALKDIIDLVQDKISAQDGPISSRTSFMIETLTNLKNNKLKRNAAQNQGGAAVDKMKKFLANLTKTRHVLAHEPLRVSLEDLHSADTMGKWWLVGAAWGGDPLVDKQTEFVKKADKEDAIPDESASLVKLARTQGMNTEIRRGIFIVLMSSDDYVDACERLSQLNLTEMQQREIIRVLLHCCGNEKTYNPYYSLVCQQLCRSSHSYKITLQYCLWDFLRDLGEHNVGGAAVVKNGHDEDGFDLKSISEVRLLNVAKAYAWWIAKDAGSLLILKPVDFTTLKSRTREFLRELLIHLFINTQRSTPLVGQALTKTLPSRNRAAIEEVFIKASRVQTLAMGLVYFLSVVFKEKDDFEGEVSKFLRWAVGVAKDTLRTGIDLGPTIE